MKTMNFDTFSTEEADKRLQFQNELIVKILKQFSFIDNVRIEEKENWGNVVRFTTEDEKVEENNCDLFVSGFRYNRPTGQDSLNIYYYSEEYSCNPSELFIPVQEHVFLQLEKYAKEHPDSYLHEIEK